MRKRDAKSNVFTRSLARFAMLLLVLPLGGYSYSALAAGPFGGLAGSWVGGGTLTLQGGIKERVRCRATYDVDGGESQVRQDLRCASDSYRFELKGDVVHSNGAVSGRWEETTRGLSGNVSGRAKGGRIDARIEGPSFAALLTLTTRGSRQTVAIRSPGSQVEEVLITLRRR